MNLSIYTFHAPRHAPSLVASHVVRQHAEEHLVRWQRSSSARELVYLATCQRVIWMLWDGEGEALGLAPEVEILHGPAAWRHLLEVATGLHSTNLGDREILGQLRQALETAKAAGTAGEEAQAAIEDVLREAQRLRTSIGLADGSASVSTTALKHLQATLPTGSSVALVGVGPMCQYLARRLDERGYRVTMANRTRSKAEAMGFPTVALAQLQQSPAGFDALITATTSPEPLFTLDAWSRAKVPALLLLDLALPCDSEPALAQLPWIERRDLSALTVETAQAKARRREAAEQAEPWIQPAALRLQERADSRSRKRSLRTAQDLLSASWQNLLDDAFAASGPLAGLSPAQREEVEAVLRKGRTLAFRSLNLAREAERTLVQAEACA